MGKVPTPVLDVLFGPLKARVVMASVNLGLIDALAQAPSTAAQLASALKLNPDSVEMLLRALVHCEYLNWDGTLFSLSKLARRALAPGAPMDRRGFVEWNYTQWEMLGHVDDLIRFGRGIDLHETLTDPKAWSLYQRAMLENARDHAALLAQKVRVPTGATSLIDLGGSHGLLGAAICRKHPAMRSTVFDLEPALASARELAGAEGIGGLVTHVVADILKDDLGAGHDVALLANILHHFTPAENAALLKKVHRSLRAGGTVAIWEFEKPKRNDKVSAGDALALYFRLTSSASTYHADEYTAWLQAAGFNSIRVLRPKLVPGYVLVSAGTIRE
jgi:hypothetical protein